VGWWRFFLAAIAAALTVLLGAGTASAVTVPVLETRVGASTPTVARVVGVHECITAGQRWGNAPPAAVSVVATGVAAKAEVGGGGQIFTHFTDADGVAGIAGVGPLNVGESVGVGSLKFGQGGNRFLAGAAGDNFVTDLGVNASARQLEGIGVFGAKQQYAIQFSQEAAFNSGVRPVMVKQNIFTIPGGSCISGACVVTRVR
jgi:hypothetical protein